jgi:hypothetical protein
MICLYHCSARRLLATARRCFAAWKLYSQHHHNMRALQHRRASILVQSTWITWQDEARRLHHLRHVTKHATKYSRAQQLKRIWRAWKYYVAHVVTNRNQVAIEAKRRLALKRVVSQWRTSLTDAHGGDSLLHGYLPLLSMLILFE